MKKFSRYRVFYSYLISYVSVVLVAAAVISVLFSYQFIQKIKNETQKVTQNKVYTALVDMSNQLDAIEGMAFSMVAAEEFRPEYFNKNKYYEIEALNRLKRYNNTSPIVSYYFLLYGDNGMMFTSGGTKMPFSAYFSERFATKQNSDEIFNEIAGAGGLTLINTGAAGKTQPVYLIVCPLQRYALNEPGNAAILCCEITPDQINRRITQMVGEIDGELAVYLDGTLMNKTEVPEDSDGYEVSSADGRIRIQYYGNTGSLSGRQQILSGQSMAILVIILAGILVVAVFAAYRSYMPIRSLLKKYALGTDTGKNKINELERIDLFIDLLMQKDAENNKQLREQYGMMRDQMINLILSGGYRTRFGERLLWLNLRLDGPFYGTMLVKLCGTEALEEVQVKKLGKGIEELSDDEISLYSAYEGSAEENSFYILASMKEQYQMEEAMESVRSLFELEGYQIELFCDDVCGDLKKIQKAKVVNNEKVFEEIAAEEEKGIHKQNRIAEKIVAYIDENCTQYDLSLDKVAGEFNVTPTYLCRLIKQQTGVSYKNYLINLRVEAAKQMLRDRDISISDVCRKAGYANVSHFIKIFQRLTGVTPAKFRDSEVILKSPEQKDNA